MISFADRLLAMPRSVAFPALEVARDLLKRPRDNHAPIAHGEFALCDRFHASPQLYDVCKDSFGDEQSFPALSRADIHPPAFPCWLELFGAVACLVDGNDECFDVTFFASAGRNVWPFLHVRCINKTRTKEFAPSHPRVAVTEADANRYFVWFAAVCALIANPRATTVKRTRPGTLSPAMRAFALRRAQRGMPVYSYNVVDIVAQKTALHRGEMRTAESFAGMRRHQVIGHWRLDDGVAEPIFMWIVGYKRGDERRGKIIKERHIATPSGAPRRGYLVPATPGKKGERRPAIRIQDEGEDDRHN